MDSSIWSRTQADAAVDRRILRTIAAVVASALSLYLVYRLRTPLLWLVIATILAIAASGPVNLLARKMRRGLAIAIVYMTIFLVPLAFGAALIPPLVNSAVDLARDAPAYAQDVQDQLERNATFRKINRDFKVYERLRDGADSLSQNLGDAAGTLGSIGASALNSIFAGFTILIMSMFMVSRGRGWIDAWIRHRPAHEAEALDRTVSRIGAAVGGYIGGALVQALIAGVSAFVVLAILGMPSPLVLATVVAVFDVIPMVGSTIAGVLVTFVTFFADFPIDTIVWVIFFISYQQFENYVVQPQIQKRAVQLEPFIVLIAVIFGGTLMGVVGALLAIPAAATLQIVWQEGGRFRREMAAPGEAESATPL